MCNLLPVQAMGDSEKNAYMRGQKTLEINPYHPLIQELKTLVRTTHAETICAFLLNNAQGLTTLAATCQAAEFIMCTPVAPAVCIPKHTSGAQKIVQPRSVCGEDSVIVPHISCHACMPCSPNQGVRR